MSNSNFVPNCNYIAVGDAYWDFCFISTDHLPSQEEQVVFVPGWASRNPAGSLGYMAMALSTCLDVFGLRIIANVGDERDFYSNEWRRRLGAVGVDVSLVHRITGASIGAGVLFIRPNGERWIIGSYGANAHPLFLPEVTLEHVNTLLVAGFCQTPGLWNEHTVTSLHHFKSKPGKIVMLDPNWNPDPEAKQNLLKVLPYVDVFLPNQEELFLTADEHNATQAAAKLVEQFQLVVIAKLGQDGCLVADTSTVRYLPAEKVSVVDTTGAGDLFYAAFVASYARTDGDILAAAAFANRLAGASIQHLTLEDKLNAISTVARF